MVNRTVKQKRVGVSAVSIADLKKGSSPILLFPRCDL